MPTTSRASRPTRSESFRTSSSAPEARPASSYAVSLTPESRTRQRPVPGAGGPTRRAVVRAVLRRRSPERRARRHDRDSRRIRAGGTRARAVARRSVDPRHRRSRSTPRRHPVHDAPLTSALAARGIEALDAAPDLDVVAGARGPCAVYTACGRGHLSAEGNAVLARLVAQRVRTVAPTAVTISGTARGSPR